MVLQDWYLVIALVVLLVFLSLLIWLIRFQMKNQLEIQKVNQGFVREILRNQTNSNDSSMELMDKLIAILGTKDPLSFQQVQAMNSGLVSPTTEPVDNSDHGEMLQWVVDNENQLTPTEKDLYRGISDF